MKPIKLASIKVGCGFNEFSRIISLYEFAKRFRTRPIKVAYTRMYGVDTKDVLKGMVKYVPANPYRLYVMKCEEQIPYIFKYDDNKNEFVKFCTEKEFIDNPQYMKEYVEMLKEHEIIEQLTRKNFDILDTFDFFNGQIYIKNGQKGYACKKIPFVPPISNFFFVAKASKGIKFIDIDYKNSVYCYTNGTGVSYVFVPEEVTVGYHCDNDTIVIIDGIKMKYTEDMDERLEKLAIDADEFKIIDIEDKDTRLFFSA